MRIVSELCVVSKFGVSCTQESVKSNILAYLLSSFAIKVLSRELHELPECIRDIDVNYLVD